MTTFFTTLTKPDTLHELYSAINTKAYDWLKVTANKHKNNSDVVTCKASDIFGTTKK